MNLKPLSKTKQNTKENSKTGTAAFGFDAADRGAALAEGFTFALVLLAGLLIALYLFHTSSQLIADQDTRVEPAAMPAPSSS